MNVKLISGKRICGRNKTEITGTAMDALAQLGSILGLSFISGINLYATVAATGLCIKFGLIQNLPPELQVFANDAVIFVALFLYFIEFFADKIQGLDTLWDGIHTVIRPIGGAVIALMQVGEASPALEVIVFLLGASAASAAHLTKAGTRLVVNASPEPFSNIAISVVEDAAVIGFSYLTLAHPKLSFFLTLVFLLLIAMLLPFLYRSFRMIVGAVFARIGSLFVRSDAREGLKDMTLSQDRCLEKRMEEGDEPVWAGKAYATRITSIPRFSRVTLVMTRKRLFCLYKRWFRLRDKSLLRSEINKNRFYRGRLFAKWLIGTPEETWTVEIYRPLEKNRPHDLSTRATRKEEQADPAARSSN